MCTKGKPHCHGRFCNWKTNHISTSIPETTFLQKKLSINTFLDNLFLENVFYQQNGNIRKECKQTQECLIITLTHDLEVIGAKWCYSPTGDDNTYYVGCLGL